MVLMRTAKSCGSDAPMLASSLREEAQAMVSNKPGHRGEREASRKTIARGMPGDFRCDRGDYARVLFYFAREAAGASSARHSLLIFRRRDVLGKPRAGRAARSRKLVCERRRCCLKIESAWVVPAKAGTHNHRHSWLHESRRTASLNTRDTAYRSRRSPGRR